MTVQDYQCSIQASLPATEAVDRISRIAEWWTEDFTGSARKPGDTFKVRFGETFVDFKIVEASPDMRIVWQVANCHLSWLKNKTEWNGTSVVWELSLSDGATTVTMTHRGLVPGIECYGKCEAGWNFFVGKSLQQFLTTGQGLPGGEKKRAEAD